MSKKKTIELNGRTFTLCKERTNGYCSQRSLNSCYARPSQTKLAIWSSWSQWFYEQGSTDFGVASYNSNFFTIEGFVEKDGQPYYVYITSTRQEAHPYIGN